jgi:hypothetical protein
MKKLSILLLVVIIVLVLIFIFPNPIGQTDTSSSNPDVDAFQRIELQKYVTQINSLVANYQVENKKLPDRSEIKFVDGKFIVDKNAQNTESAGFNLLKNRICYKTETRDGFDVFILGIDFGGGKWEGQGFGSLNVGICGGTEVIWR